MKILSVFVLVCCVIGISYNGLFDTFQNMTQSVQNSFEIVNGVFGILSDRVVPPVNVVDTTNPSPLGTYQFEGQSESVSDYLLRDRLDLGNYYDVIEIYPNTYNITVNSFLQGKKDYQECIRFRASYKLTGKVYEFLYCHYGFTATTATRYFVSLHPLHILEFYTNSMLSTGFGYYVGLSETQYSVNSLVNESFID